MRTSARITLAAGLGFLAAGCAESTWVWTLNPDGTGKVELDALMQPTFDVFGSSRSERTKWLPDDAFWLNSRGVIKTGLISRASSDFAAARAVESSMAPTVPTTKRSISLVALSSPLA